MLIKRQDAIDAIETKEANEFGNYMKYNVAFNDGLRAAVSVLEDLPSAQPKPITVNIDHELTPYEYEKLRKDMANAPIMLLPSAQKKGEWIDADTFKVKCSVCDYCCDISAKFLYSFCPNCGTDLRGNYECTDQRNADAGKLPVLSDASRGYQRDIYLSGRVSRD